MWLSALQDVQEEGKPRCGSILINLTPQHLHMTILAKGDVLPDFMSKVLKLLHWVKRSEMVILVSCGYVEVFTGNLM